MSGISSGVGLISGIPIQSLVDQLMAIQSRPLNDLQANLQTLTNKRTALLQISAGVLALQSAATRFDSTDLFRTTTANSSNSAALLATASQGATPAQYQLSVRNLATSQQLLSRGFATSDATLVGAGTLTIAPAAARVNTAAGLGSLLGGTGVARGKIRLTDRAGGAADVDLTAAATITDVATLINNQSTAKVSASIQGDRLVLTDRTGLSSGSLVVTDLAGGKSASQLGVAGSFASGSVSGVNLVAISSATLLSDLNDGNGVRHSNGIPDINATLADGTSLTVDLSNRLSDTTPLSSLNGGSGITPGKIHIANRAGTEKDIDLTGATTLGDVKTAIEGAGLNLSVALADGHILLTDNSTATTDNSNATTVVSEVGTGTTAKSLGLLGSSSTGSITGKSIYAVNTVGDLVRVINHASGNGGKLVASISSDGLGLTLRDTTSGAGTFTLTPALGSKTLDDLGLTGASSGGQITSRRLVSGLDSVLLRSLRGGKGIGTAGQPSQIKLTDRSGASATVDLSSAQTFSDVVGAINAAGTGISAAISSNGLGLRITDSSSGSGSLKIEDVSGTAANDLNLIHDGTDSQFDSGGLQRQYISEATKLSAIRGGVPAGKFKITDSSGQNAIVDLTQGNETTLQDVIDEINSRGIGVTAKINDAGDGLIVNDTAGGAGKLKIEEQGGTTATALGIAGSSADGTNYIDGSLEYKINVEGSDTLSDVLAKIKASGAGVNASIINDGSGGASNRLSLTSNATGRAGELAIDGGATGLSFDTLVAGRDATVLFGPSESPLVINSSSNTITSLIAGVRLDLVAPTDTPLTVNVSQDSDTVAKSFSTFVTAFNTVLDTIDKLTNFDTATNTASPLTSDPTAQRIRDRLVGLVNKVSNVPGSTFKTLASVGISFSQNSDLAIDTDKFKAALTSDPAGVEALFTQAKTGLGVVIKGELNNLTDTDTGLISVQDQSLQSSQDVITQRITQMQALLDTRRQRLLDQFNSTESILAKLQTQQSALTSLASLAAVK